jgi:hypothetical protein
MWESTEIGNSAHSESAVANPRQPRPKFQFIDSTSAVSIASSVLILIAASSRGGNPHPAEPDAERGKRAPL